MELQRQILLFFSQHATSMLDSLAQFFTLFGEGVVAVAVSLFIFLCIDKKKGFTIVFTFLAANSVINIVKAIVRFPRPWVMYPEIECKKMSTATGYSFPSGHTTCTSSMLGTTAVLFKKKVISIISAILILFVGISRSYLCCHWPMDVACGWLLGLFFAFFVSPMVFRLFEKKEVIYKVFPFAGIVLALAGLFVATMIDCKGWSMVLFKDLSEAFALIGFGLLSFAVEEKRFCFAISPKWVKRIAGYLIAIIGAIFFVVVLKKFVPQTGFWAWVRYSLVAIWSCGLFPWFATKTGLMDKEAEK